MDGSDNYELVQADSPHHDRRDLHRTPSRGQQPSDERSKEYRTRQQEEETAEMA